MEQQSDFPGCPPLGVNHLEEKDDAEQNSFEKIIALLKSRIKHDFSLYKPNSIHRRIERRMGIHKVASLGSYARLIQHNNHEVHLLFKELLIGVTNFFRDQIMWDELASEALPTLFGAYPEGGIVRAWSCGCSTGEEAYSLAILFREYLDRLARPENFTLQIFATDLDADAIERARRGVFPASIEADVSAERLTRFFVKEEDTYRICSEIREMITFAQQNVAMDPPFTKLDILICRNLLIYLSTELQQRLLPLFHYSLKPGGLLFLGSAETVGSQTDFFSVPHGRSKLFWRNDIPAHNVSIAFPAHTTFNTYAPLLLESPMNTKTENLQHLADSLILQHCSTPAVITTDQGDIVYISGKTGKYLEPAAGKANMNIFAMIREGLRYELGTAFNKVLQQREPVTMQGTLPDTHNLIQTVDLLLVKIEAPDTLRGMVLISFKDVSPPSKVRRRKTGALAERIHGEEYEQELLKSREEMQTTHEELKSTNEELQSTNEELQSTNEELTTSKEEMQSMNEELQSVNAEQAIRLEEYMRVNNDMENLLNSTEIVTVFLDNHLQVRRFTTGANRLFKLIPGDIGRSLTDIVSDLNYPNLYDHVQDVLRKLISVESQASTLDGRFYMVRIMPYRTLHKAIDGVVITCIDITATKKVENALRDEIAKLKEQITG